MGSVIVYTLSKVFTTVISVDHFMRNGSNFLTNCIFKLFNRLKAVTVWMQTFYLYLVTYPRKKSHGSTCKSGERAGKPMSPSNEINEINWSWNISLKILSHVIIPSVCKNNTVIIYSNKKYIGLRYIKLMQHSCSTRLTIKPVIEGHL